jgi:DEAD/DEAH box helicase
MKGMSASSVPFVQQRCSLTPPSPALNGDPGREWSEGDVSVCRLGGHSPKGGARALLLAPTRELVLQTHKVVKELGRYMDLRTAVLLGGDSMEAQFAELASFPDILLAAPGIAMTFSCSVTLANTEFFNFIFF